MSVTPWVHDGVVDAARTFEFAQGARALTAVARRLGLVAPSFRCPPRLVGADRTIRRRGGRAVVSVRVRGRPIVAVHADMVEGVVVTNGLETPDADRVRSELWETLTTEAEPRNRKVEAEKARQRAVKRFGSAGSGAPA